MKNGHLYSTEYFIWDNMGLEKTDKNLATYQMGAAVTKPSGHPRGHHDDVSSEAPGHKNTTCRTWKCSSMICFYGKQYAFGGENPYVPTDLKIGVGGCADHQCAEHFQKLYVHFGRNFTQYSKLYVNDKEQETQLYNENALILRDMKLKKGDVLVVKQVDKNGLKCWRSPKPGKCSNRKKELYGIYRGGSVSAGTKIYKQEPAGESPAALPIWAIPRSSLR